MKSVAASSGFRSLWTATVLGIAIAWLTPLPNAAAAPRHAVSALRAPDHGFLDQALATLPDAGTTDDATPWSVQGPLESLDLSNVPAVGAGQLQSLFEKLRDAREWKWDARPEFARRIPWLYVD